MEETVGRNEYMDLAKEANILWHQMESKNTFQEIITELEQWGAKNLLNRNEWPGVYSSTSIRGSAAYSLAKLLIDSFF